MTRKTGGGGGCGEAGFEEGRGGGSMMMKLDQMKRILLSCEEKLRYGRGRRGRRMEGKKGNNKGSAAMSGKRRRAEEEGDKRGSVRRDD